MECVNSINGNTDLYGVVGYPVSHSFSPVIHNTLAKILNHNIVYTAFEVSKEGLQKAIEGAYELGIKGLNITVPHKQNVMNYLYDIDDFAKKVGAVNTLKYTKKGYIGYNTDVYGLKSCLDFRNIDLKNKIVVLVGAGGAAKAAAIMLASNNIKKLYIINRTLNNAHLLAQNVKTYYNVNIDILSYDEIDKIDRADICIQTTSVGMFPNVDCTAINCDEFYKKIDIAVDIIFNPWITKFLTKAKAENCEIINGFDMLYFQAVKSYEIWQETKIDENIKLTAKNMLELYYNKK